MLCEARVKKKGFQFFFLFEDLQMTAKKNTSSQPQYSLSHYENIWIFCANEEWLFVDCELSL